jgi:membrane-associated phospholipid phosphatase
MRLHTVAAVAGAALLAASAADAAAAAKAPGVADWIEVTLAEIASHGVNPPRAARTLALVSVAMEAAAGSRGSGQRTAVASAASRVLMYIFPDGRARFEALAGFAWKATPGERARGRALGLRVAAEAVVRAEGDGSHAAWSGAVPVGAGFWTSTPPGFVYPPLEPLAGSWRTWNVVSRETLRPAEPPWPGSVRFEAEMREVYEVSQALTPAQKAVADFWADGRGTATPPGHWNAIALDLIRARRLDERFVAFVFATLNTAQADAFIWGWDATFTYWSIRPVTAIRREIDPGWLPYLVTPPFPSYVSGHAATSGAAADVLAFFFPDRAAQLRAWAEEAALSRLLGGIHFRVDNEAGLTLGRRVAAAALAHAASGRGWLPAVDEDD